MSPVGILFLIFATCVLLVGLYMFTGHKLDIMTWRVAFRNLSIDDWKRIGKYTMLASLLIYLLAVVAIIFNFGN